MPLYEYRGFNAQGKATKGVRDAETPKALRAQSSAVTAFLSRTLKKPRLRRNKGARKR